MKIHSFYTFLVLCLLSLSLFAIVPTKAKGPFEYQHYFLKNGLQVVIIPHKDAPVVYHSIWYKVGSADSPPHKHGLAHFLEHLMFNGSQKFPNDTYKRKVNDLGGSQNANTSWDRTAYFVTIAKEYLPLIMEMEADRMKHLNFTQAAIDKEKEVVLQERRSTTEADPNELVAEAANAAFFWEHPYGKPILGFEKDILNYTLNDAKQFYETWYHPNNAILVLAGDINVTEAKRLIERYYGGIAKGSVPERVRPQEPDHHGACAKIEKKSPRLGTGFQKIYAAPNHRSRGMKTEAALTLLESILGNATFGRLKHTLVEHQKLAEFVGADYVGNYYDPFNLTVSGSPKNATDLKQLESSVEAEIRRMMIEGIRPEELAKAKEQWTFANRYHLDSITGKADYFGEHLAMGYTMEALEHQSDIFQNVTASEIQDLAKEIFSKGPAVITRTYNVSQ